MEKRKQLAKNKNKRKKLSHKLEIKDKMIDSFFFYLRF